MELLTDFARKLIDLYGDYGPIDVLVPEEVFYRIRTDVGFNIPREVSPWDHIELEGARVRIKPANEENRLALKMFRVPDGLNIHTHDAIPDGEVYVNQNTKLFVYDLIQKGIK